MVSEAFVVTAGDDVVSCDLAGGAALLDLRSSTYYSLNGVGSQVWELIQQPKTISEVRDALLMRYDVDPVRCYADLVGLLQQLAAAGLVKVTDAADT